MNTLSRWMRDNLLIVGCAAVMLLSVAGLFWPIGPQIAAFKVRLARADDRLEAIRRHIDRREAIPSEDPGERMRRVNLTVNEKAVEALNAIYRTMTVSYETMLESAITFNRGDRRYIRPDLFPTEPTNDSWRPSNTVALGAIEPYRRSFAALYQRMNAGTLPGESQIQQRMQRVEDRYEAETVEAAGEGSSELARRKARALQKLYMQRAKTLSVYAEPPGTDADGTFSPGVFHATRLATRVDTPPTAELWKSQMQLWIQRDIADAIALANRDPQSRQPLPVTEAPVKRVLALSVASDYRKPPGLDGDGSAAATSPEALDKPLPPNFHVSSTGRVSNPLYDVWIAEIKVIIESRAIPRLLNALGQVNFITSIHREVRPVTPPVAEQFRDGYVYGDTVDLVELSLQLETLWMRAWTVGAYDRAAVEAGEAAFGPMPDAVRVSLGIPPRAEDFQREGRTTGDGRDADPRYREGPGGPPRDYPRERY